VEVVLRRSHRERGRLVRERTAHINRINGPLFGQGIRGINVKSQYKTLAVDKLVTGDGHRLPPRLACEIAREIQRLAMVQEQIAKVERERDTAPTPCVATECKRHLLLQLKSIGPAISALLSREVYYRQFANRRQVGSFLGLGPSPYNSGEEERCHEISRAGSGQVRAIMIETPWLWIRQRPKSALTRRFVERTAGQSTRVRKTTIVAYCGPARAISGLTVRLMKFLFACARLAYVGSAGNPLRDSNVKRNPLGRT
jgi:transposase